jgi:hypothetical protein
LPSEYEEGEDNAGAGAGTATQSDASVSTDTVRIDRILDNVFADVLFPLCYALAFVQYKKKDVATRDAPRITIDDELREVVVLIKFARGKEMFK